MKRVINASILLTLLVSCQKEYNCTATIETEIYGEPKTLTIQKKVVGKKERDNFIEQNESLGATVNCK